MFLLNCLFIVTVYYFLFLPKVRCYVYFQLYSEKKRAVNVNDFTAKVLDVNEF